jgi:uncharacterized protein
MFGRKHDLSHVRALLSRYPVVGIIGARQIGKTTLARGITEVQGDPVSFLDLEDPSHLSQLADPMLGLRDREGLVVIDEVQRLPEVFTVLRVLADRPALPARFLVLGSASPDLLRQGSESLAGRISYYHLSGFSLLDAGGDALERLWVRGGFPRSFLADSDALSDEWRRGFIQTFLERDLPQLGIGVPAQTLRRFWTMLAHGHGQVWNASSLARSFGVSDTTVRRYLDHLTSALVVRQLQPWHENLKKRQVKAPKVYLADSGLLHTLLGLASREDLLGHPILGSSWEGFLLNEVSSHLGARPDECHFWATHAGAELDLLIVRGRRRRGFEFKRTVAPKVTRSMRTAITDLGLDQLDVIHAGDESFPLAKGIRAVAASRLHADLDPL